MFSRLIEINLKFENHERDGNLIREFAWFGEITYTYSSTHAHSPNETWPACLIEMKEKIKTYLQKSLNLDFECNSLLINKYASGHQSIGWHSDDEKCLGKQPVIASLSFGETRVFELKRKPSSPTWSGKSEDIMSEVVRVPLPSGSLLVMMGATQQDWIHRVPKEYHDRGLRFNLTFRKTHEASNVVK